MGEKWGLLNAKPLITMHHTSEQRERPLFFFWRSIQYSTVQYSMHDKLADVHARRRNTPSISPQANRRVIFWHSGPPL